MISVRHGKWEDVEKIGRLRDADNEELKASLGLCPGFAIRKSWFFPGDRYVFLKDGEVIALLGCSGTGLKIGIPWLLGTDELKHAGMTLVKYGRLLCKRWLRRNEMLVNYVDCRHKTAIAWCERIGFKIYPPEGHGVEGRLFHKIEMRR